MCVWNSLLLLPQKAYFWLLRVLFGGCSFSTQILEEKFISGQGAVSGSKGHPKDRLLKGLDGVSGFCFWGSENVPSTHKPRVALTLVKYFFGPAKEGAKQVCPLTVFWLAWLVTGWLVGLLVGWLVCDLLHLLQRLLKTAHGSGLFGFLRHEPDVVVILPPGHLLLR